MGYNVSSSFIAESISKNPTVIRKFTIAGSDYSERISKWPRFKRKWNDIRPISLNLDLANNDQGMNFIRQNKTLMVGECLIQFGFDTPSGEELITLFSGKISNTTYKKEKCILRISDKFQQLSERKVGTTDEPVNYLSSDYLPSDIAWWIVTSYGGYSGIMSDSNPDIDYAAFNDWAKIFSGDSVFIQSQFDGQKCTEILRKLARHTRSTIFIKEDKLSFHRFGIADPLVSSLGDGQIKDLELVFDTNLITNRQFVSGDYSVESDFHQFTITDESTASVSSFGVKENLLEDTNVWYVNSTSAINLAQRIILSDGEPEDSIRVTTTLVGLPRLIGETITINDGFHGIAESYRILEHEVDTDKGRIIFRVDRTQLTNAFILDASTLDNTEEVLS